jgi:hypothetical protein
VTVHKRNLMEPFFVHGTYFVLLTMVAFWASTYIIALKGTTRDTLVAWLKDNWRGLVLAAAVSLVAILAIQPALRVLADETNLLGVSKNLHFNKTADFATTGKWYYEAYWNLNVTTDRRPALFPFLVSLLHSFWGYSYTNAFHVNAILIPLFVFRRLPLGQIPGRRGLRLAGRRVRRGPSHHPDVGPFGRLRPDGGVLRLGLGQVLPRLRQGTHGQPPGVVVAESVHAARMSATKARPLSWRRLWCCWLCAWSSGST